MSVLCIIPARKGSKGVKKKNLKKIGEYSLVERALFVALNTPEIDDVIVSTDSLEIQRIINKYGEYCPFIRPDNLATDTATSLEVILHSLHWAQKHLLKSYTYIVLLEPPTPFRLSRHVSSALEIMKDKGASSVVSLISVGDHHPIRMKKINKDLSVLPFYKEEPQGLRRQDQEKSILEIVRYMFLMLKRFYPKIYTDQTNLDLKWIKIYMVSILMKKMIYYSQEQNTTTLKKIICYSK